MMASLLIHKYYTLLLFAGFHDPTVLFIFLSLFMLFLPLMINMHVSYGNLSTLS